MAWPKRLAVLPRRQTPSHHATESDRGTGTTRGGETTRFARLGPAGVVLAPIVFSAIELRSEISYVPHLNDSAFHSEMVRYAVAQFRSGHLPLDGWFPYLGLGSPLFLHYQSLGAMTTGILGLVIGANESFSLLGYLLVVTWPTSVYAAGRLFGWSRWESAFAALVAPFVISVTGIGYEQGSYLWSGFGLWSQAWAMWTLPIAWGFTWRAIDQGRSYLLAALFVALTCALHFETGYLAFAPIVLWILVRPSRTLQRARRALVVGAGGLCLVAWVIVPLLVYRGWSSIDEYLQAGPDARSYGAGQVLSWLFTGQIFDYGRAAIVTALAGLGLVACLVRWRHDVRSRAVVAASCLSLVLFFGPASLGFLEMLPGSQNIFFRRFIIGVQLSGILLAGVGAVAIGRLAFVGARRLFGSRFEAWNRRRWRVLVARVLLAGLVVGTTAPMWSEIASHETADASLIATQRAATTEQMQVNRLIATIKRIGGGRVYAGMSFWGWGAHFLVGLVPVSEYLANDQVDEIGFTNRTSSLMSDPEAYFDDADPADFALFGVRFVISPAGRPAPPGAHLLQQAGPYRLWILPQDGYVQVVDTFGPGLVEDKAHMGSDSAPFVRSDLAGEGLYPVVAFGGRRAATPTLSSPKLPTGPAGRVLGGSDNLPAGEVTARVSATRPAVVLLKATFDPGWTATVDGRPEPTEMIAPAYVGVRVSRGTHDVVFRYRAYPDFPELFALALAAMAVLGFGPRLWRRLSADAARQTTNNSRRRTASPGARSDPPYPPWKSKGLSTIPSRRGEPTS